MRCGDDSASGIRIYRYDMSNCGWGWATTLSDPTDNDDTKYEIWLRPVNSQSSEILHLIADISNVNLLQAKKMLSCHEPVMLYKACNEAASSLNKVQKIQAIAGYLKKRMLSSSSLPISSTKSECKYEITNGNAV